MKQRLLLLFFILCVLCLMGTALIVCQADVPSRLSLPTDVPVFRIFSLVTAPVENKGFITRPAIAGKVLPVIDAAQPVLPLADANGTPLAAGRHFKAAYTAFHYSDKAG